MRRAFVLFLILLFPLNVFALSMSVATLGQQAPAALAGAGQDGAFDCDNACDIDPDEPPSGAQLHYIVDRDRPAPFAGPRRAGRALHDAAPDCRAIPPPVKPPRAA